MTTTTMTTTSKKTIVKSPKACDSLETHASLRKTQQRSDISKRQQHQHKRCGIYERDSEFVNDILNVFDSFVQRKFNIDDDIRENNENDYDRESCDEFSNLNFNLNSLNNSKYKNAFTKCKSDAITIIEKIVDNKTTTDNDNKNILNSRCADDKQCCDLSSTKTKPIEHKSDDDQPHQIGASDTQQLERTHALTQCADNIQQNYRAYYELERKTTRTTFNTELLSFDVVNIFKNLLLSRSLNRVIIFYDKTLWASLQRHCMHSDRFAQKFKFLPLSHDNLLRKYLRFAKIYQRAAILNNCEKVKAEKTIKYSTKRKSVEEKEIVAKSLSEEKSGHFTVVISNANVSDNKEKTSETLKKCNEVINSEYDKQNQIKGSDNKVFSDSRVTTFDYPTSHTEYLITNDDFNDNDVKKMTVPIKNFSSPNNACIDDNDNGTFTQKNQNVVDDEEDIYQPIWKFKTVGEVQERYHTDADYYDISDTTTNDENLQFANDSAAIPVILVSNNVGDQGEWETDDEFMFTTKLNAVADGYDDDDISFKQQSYNMSTATTSTITTTPTSTSMATPAPMASTLSGVVAKPTTSLTHHLFRNIGIFYSKTKPNIRAIIYDYDRVHSTAYFAKPNITTTKTATKTIAIPKQNIVAGSIKIEIEKSQALAKSSRKLFPIPPPRTTSAAKTLMQATVKAGVGESVCGSGIKADTTIQQQQKKLLLLLPDSVQAWKFMLLDVNYLEDEEDLIVSETEMSRSVDIKGHVEMLQSQQTNILQRFKSVSIGNLIDLPIEDDKKSIAERMRNKLQRGVFKLRSPKSEKKNRNKFRRAEATSLYLEDGIKPKYPIFNAPLEQLEPNTTCHPNVPRFVVDCVEYIEQKDCINQDGLYRASGNKVAIDDLKQKIVDSYIYDPKLLVTDDIHTLTSLFKLFFRELPTPLIPQEINDSLTGNLINKEGVERIRLTFQEMREPNLSTLKYIIKHLRNVASYSSENRMPASNLAIIWGPCLLASNIIQFDIGRMNTLAKTLILNYEYIFGENERLVC